MIRKNADPDLGIFLIRLALALVFIVHGWDKMTNINGVIGFFGSLGLPPLFAYLVAAAELFGGLAMLLGVFTHWAGIALAAVMVGAIYLVKFQNGLTGTMIEGKMRPGYEFDLVLLLAALGVALIGPGRHTIEKLMKRS